MDIILPWSFNIILMVGYVVFSILLNTVALLISSFYQKKVNQAAPKIGFILSIVFSLMFVIVVLTFQKSSIILQLLTVFSLLGSALASAFSTLHLVFTMRMVRK